MTILQDLTATSNDELMIELMLLREENAKLKASKAKNGLKVSEKGAVSMYGYGKFPITMYKTTLRDILSRKEELEQFMVDNESKLTTKPVKE